MARKVVVDAKAADIARYARRGVTVISLPGAKSDYGQILATAFSELRDHLLSEIMNVSSVTEERPRTELSLPRDALTRLCFFAVGLDDLPLYRERIFPAVEEAGFVPVTADDVITPGDSAPAKIDALIDRAAVVVVEPTSAWTEAELRLALNRKLRPELRSREQLPVIVVLPKGQREMPRDVVALSVVTRAPWGENDADFTAVLTSALQAFRPAMVERRNEPQRLLDAKEYRAAVIAAMSLLEAELRQKLEKPDWNRVGRPMTMKQLSEAAAEQGHIPASELPSIADWSAIRNSAVHSGALIPRNTAQSVVKGVQELLADNRVG